MAGVAAGYHVLKNSVNMFVKSVINPKEKHYDDNSSLAKTVKKSKVFKERVKSHINDYNKQGPRKEITRTFTNTKEGLYFSKKSSIADFDAKYSIGHANYTMDITKLLTNKGTQYKIDISMNDTYNFDGDISYNGITNSLNSLGLFCQDLGISRNYEWDLNFTMYILESELNE